MIHELDAVFRNYGEDRLPRPPATPLPSAQCDFRGKPEGARLGLRPASRPMKPAAMRVLETTWRVWREPPAVEPLA